MNDPKGGVAKVTCPTFEAIGQIPAFHRTYFLLAIKCFLILTRSNLRNICYQLPVYHTTRGHFMTPVNSGVKKCTRVHGPSTRPVNSGSGNRALDPLTAYNTDTALTAQPILVTANN